MQSDIFVEMECCQLNHHGEDVCGDDYLFERLEAENRHIAVLSDGLGSGIKANLLSTMTTTMALHFVRSNRDVLQSAEIIMDTLPVCEIRKVSYATFTMLDLQIGGRCRAIEMDNPPFIYLRNGHDCALERQTLISARWPSRKVHLADFFLERDDRLIAFSDGVTQAGLGAGYKLGWRREGVLQFIQESVEKNPEISARDLSRAVVYAAKNHNLHQRCTDDISCMVVYLRAPRKLRLLTGPPFYNESDTAYSNLVRDFDGKTILCGGTTAKIVSRELNVPVHVDLTLMPQAGGLPPPSNMRGVDLVTEGILTLTDVVQRIEQGDALATSLPLASRKMVELFRESDEIELIVGTRVNEAHQDPNLPVGLEIRRNIVQRLHKVLEEKYRKRVRMKFF